MKAKTEVDVKNLSNLDETKLVKREMVTFSFRVDRDLKREVEKVFDQMGVSMSGAINMFLAQTVVEQGLPFRPRVQVNSKRPVKKEDPLDNIDYMTLEELCAEL